MAHNISFDNFTVGSNGTAATNLHNAEFCPPYEGHIFEAMDSSAPYIVNAALNVVLAITTTFANLLVLLALRHISSIRLPSKLLLYSLLLSDLGAGLVIQPQVAALLLMKTTKFSHSVISCFLFKSNDFLPWLLGGVSVGTMTAISLDRYTALFYHLRYQQIVTTRRVSAVLIFIWLFSVFIASTGFWDWVVRYYTVTISFVTCFLVMSVSYIKIYRGLRRQSGQVQAETHAQAQLQAAGNTLNMARYKKIASAMLWVYVLFFLCFVIPIFYGTLRGATFKDTALTQCIWEFFYTVSLVNSCLNPFVYCVRLPDIRTEVLKILRNFYCLCSQQKDSNQETLQDTTTRKVRLMQTKCEQSPM